MEPPVMELEIIAAFDDTEGAAPAHGDLDRKIYTQRGISISIYRRLIECLYVIYIYIISH